MKLFLVTCRGMHDGHGIAYVVAHNAAEAFARMHDNLAVRSLGFEKDRELDTVQLLAESVEYPPCGRRLYV